MSLNDPNWGRGGSRGPQGPGGGKQGPPDLDELWRSFNRKLNDLFGKRGGGSEPPSEGRGGPNPAQIGGGALILAGLVLIGRERLRLIVRPWRWFKPKKADA